MDIFSLVNQLWDKMRRGKLTRIGNSTGFIIPRQLLKYWLGAVEYRFNMLTGRELKVLLDNYKFLDDRKILVVIPILEDDLVNSWEEGESSV